MRLIIATLSTLALLVVFDFLVNALPFPEGDSSLEQAFSAITMAAAAAVGGYLGGRWFIPIAGCIVLGSFVVVSHLLAQIASVAEPTTLSAMLMQNWHRAIAPFGAAMLGAWGGHLLSARKQSYVRNET
jgi:hypothetical protein